MAGRKQHYIQQLLLKGFSFDAARNTSHVWVYRRDVKVFSPALEGYGAERDFYGDPEQPDLDYQITEIENNRFNDFLCGLRDGTNRDLDSDEAAAFAVHVFFRSKNIRSVLTAGLEHLMARARTILRDPCILERLVASGFRQKSESIFKGLEQAGVPRLQQSPTRAFIEQISLRFARKFIDQSSSQINALLDGVQFKVADMVAVAHRKSLSERLHDFTGTRVEQLRAMRWQLKLVSGSLILGDSVVLAELADGSFKPITEPGDALSYVWIPISHDRILVGSTRDELSDVDTKLVNRGAAACSFDAFCAYKGPSEFVSLIPLIRKSTFTLDEAGIERITRESIAKSIQ